MKIRTFVSSATMLLSLVFADAGTRARPNILIAISDDQSFAHTSAAGYPGVRTPHFDRVAREGVYFANAIVASPGCSPSRAALLTGRHTWQIGEAGTHASGFPTRYLAFTEILADAGYVVGHTGKGWGPGNFQESGRRENPAGPAWQKHRLQPPHTKIGTDDYTRNFADFLATRTAGQPFVFWYGGREPHRDYDTGIGQRIGKRLADAPPPPFLPDIPEVRSDLLDYCTEIEWFDTHLGQMLAHLEAIGELENTIIVVTSDNGMPFPRAKSNAYEYGIHVPLAIRWATRVPPGRRIDDVVGSVDLTATLLDAAGAKHPDGGVLVGRSLLGLLTSKDNGLVDPAAVAYAARERHSSARYGNLSYPQRALRTKDFLYIRNFRPERWPAGDPVVMGDDGKLAGPDSGYKDIDWGPTIASMVANRNDPIVGPFLSLAVAKRPAEELFDIALDPGCLNNLAENPAYRADKEKLAFRLEDYLRKTGDPRVIDGGEVWESYSRFGPMRQFPEPEATSVP